jgi:uncharacterized small protein (TIGR04563 family)
MAGDRRKQSLYFPEEMIDAVQAEAERQDRSLSWIIQQAWNIARPQLATIPSPQDLLQKAG